MKKEMFFTKTKDQLFFDDPKAIAKYCILNWPEDVSHILRVADEVCNQYFLFDLKWDMERTYEPVIFKEEIIWDYMPADDPEFIWQFNRHRFFICLGQAYQITGDEKYSKAFVKLITSWITNCKRTPETQRSMWRILEVGLRGEYWSKALQYFKDSEFLTEDVLELIYHSLIEHADYIVEVYNPYRYISNWGVLENHGLFDIAMTLPENKQTKEYAKIALKRLEILANVGIMNDGVQWEQSPMYHNEVLHCYLDVMILASRNNINIPKTIQNKVYKLAIANVAWKKPNHHQLMMGDSDDTDIRDIISKAAYVFKDPVLKYVGYDILDFESIWDIGMNGLRDYIKIEKQEPHFTSVALEDSGNYYMRSNWGEDSNLLHFHCGTLGAGHGHSDKLHIDLVIGGEDVLMDAGRYTYVSGEERFEFKDPMAHNTCTVDEKLFTICKDSWECSKLSQPVKQRFETGMQYEYVSGGHLGYMDLDNGVFVNRKIVHIKPEIYIIFDEFYTGGEHTYQQYFHFNENGEVSLQGNHVTYLGENIRSDLYFLSDGVKSEKRLSRISRHYNLAETNTCVKNTIKGKGFTSLITVIHGGEKEALEPITIEKLPVRSALKNIEYPSFMAEAVKIDIRDTTYIIVVCHQEVNSPTDLVLVDDCYGFGNVIVFNKQESTIGGTVLQY